MQPALRPIVRNLLLGLALVGVSFALIIHDLSNSNRPHELRFVYPVTALLTVNLAVGLTLMRCWQRFSPEGRWNLVAVLTFLLTTGYWGIGLLLWVGAAGTAWERLFPSGG